MNWVRVQRIVAPLLMAVMLWVGGCATVETGQTTALPSQPVQTTPTQVASPTASVMAGGEFNRFFPTPGAGYERVYTQEKKGFAEAKLKQNGQDIAMLSISDTANNPSAAQKFQSSTQTIAGYPAVEQGSTATAVLVASRYQVKVQSRDPNFTKSDREMWIQKFNLSGLSGLR